MLIFIDVAAGVDDIIFRMLQAGIITKAVKRVLRAVKSIFPAIYGAAEIKDVSALGIIESYDASSIIVAADEAAKTAIDLVIRKKIPKSTHGYYLTSLIRLSEDDCYINKIKELMESRAQKGKKDKYYNSRNKL